jgi:hypothetical protein
MAENDPAISWWVQNMQGSYTRHFASNYIDQRDFSGFYIFIVSLGSWCLSSIGQEREINWDGLINLYRTTDSWLYGTLIITIQLEFLPKWVVGSLWAWTWRTSIEICISEELWLVNVISFNVFDTCPYFPLHRVAVKTDFITDMNP